MVGIAAAELMLHAEVGILRIMPKPEHHVVQRFCRQARALGVTWPAEMLYGELLRSLDRTNPSQLALMHEAGWLFRGAGAGYSFFDGGVPEQTMHAAVAASYAHVTAPLDRLVDRFALLVCESVFRDVEVPDWVRQGLPVVPEIMTASDRGASVRRCTRSGDLAAPGGSDLSWHRGRRRPGRRSGPDRRSSDPGPGVTKMLRRSRGHR